MEYTKDIMELPEHEKSAITLGKFDGLHRGHKELIHKVLEYKEECKTIVFAFDVSARMLLTKEERRKELRNMGVDCLLECPLSNKMKHMSPEAFIRQILVEQLHVAHIVVGPDYRFGFQRKGNVEFLIEYSEKYHYQVHVIPEAMEGKRKVSSTFIREELNEGNMEKVEELLGEYFFTTGEVLHGRGLGHTIGIPTANLIPPKEKLMPPNGVYLTLSSFGGKLYPGMTNVGYKPTVGGEDFLGVETYLFHCQKDLYGQKSVVHFIKFLRPERKFASLQELRAQLEQDKNTGIQFFKNEFTHRQGTHV